MNLPFQHYPYADEKIILQGYAKSVDKNNHKPVCYVCICEDTDTEKKWDRYELKCGHQYHTRCLRKFWGEHNEIKCSVCGVIQELPHNQYCSHCKIWGHSELTNCPEMIRIQNQPCPFVSLGYMSCSDSDSDISDSDSDTED
jgi:hypothetical protein